MVKTVEAKLKAGRNDNDDMYGGSEDSAKRDGMDDNN